MNRPPRSRDTVTARELHLSTLACLERVTAGGWVYVSRYSRRVARLSAFAAPSSSNRLQSDGDKAVVLRPGGRCIGLRELTRDTASCLAAVELSETLVILRRGVPVASLEPLEADAPPGPPPRRRRKAKVAAGHTR